LSDGGTNQFHDGNRVLDSGVSDLTGDAGSCGPLQSEFLNDSGDLGRTELPTDFLQRHGHNVVVERPTVQ
jgi:hypothetical protein